MPRPEDIDDPGLRRLVQDAHALMRAGRSTEAVHACASAYLALLEGQPGLLRQTVEARPGLHVPSVLRWPSLGANLSADSVFAGKPRIDIVRERFSLSEAMTYYECLLETAVQAGA